MSTATRRRRYDAVLGTLALVEERGIVHLDEAAALVGVEVDELHRMLEPVLYLDFRLTARGGTYGPRISEERNFLLTEDGVLLLEQSHWLRDLATEPPPADVALHVLNAGLAFRVSGDEPPGELDDALERLAEAVEAGIHVGLDAPPLLPVAREASRRGRTLRFRYVKAGLADPSDREIQPHLVCCSWGNWYAYGPGIDGGPAKYFRIDRMADASVGEGEFDQPVDVELPEFFDLSDHAVAVTVRVPSSAMPLLEADYRVDAMRRRDGGVEVDLTVFGQAVLDHFLLRLPPEATIVGDEALAERRRFLAAGVLARYE